MATEHVADHLEEVWNKYGILDATKLEMLTHSEEPWKEARGSLAPDLPSRSVITQESMKNYYSSLIEDGK